MSTLKANKDKARFVSNPISQDALDGDWVDHEVITKYKLPEIVIDASTTESLLVSPDVITTGDKLKVLDGASMVERTAGTVTTVGSVLEGTLTSSGTNITLSGGNLTMTHTSTAQDPNSNAYGDLISDGIVTTTGLMTGSSNAIGLITVATTQSQAFYSSPNGYAYYSNGNKYNNNSGDAYGDAFTTGDTIKCVYTPSTGEIEFFKNGSSQGVAYTLAVGTAVYPAFFNYSLNDAITVTISVGSALYQAPITATSLPSTKAFFNKTIDTTLSAEDTGKCKSSTITQIGVL